MKKLLLLAGCLFIICLSACSNDDSAPTSLSGTSWKCTSSGTQVFDFTSSSAGTYSSSTEIKEYSFSYSYSKPNITIKVANGETFDGDFTSSSTLEIVNGNSPTAALKFTKE